MIHRGGRRVSKGLYWSLIDGMVVDVNEGAVLPGGRKVFYVRRPPGGAYVVIPAIVLLVVITLPLTSTMGYLIAWFAPLVIVAGGVLFVCGKLAYYGFRSAAEGWEPLKAYFTGSRKKRK